ncbi:MAG: DNA-directed RNA polymerase subunit beta', partial [Parcubacteria group bacterium Gr01-1014_66]
MELSSSVQISDFHAIGLRLASPDKILSWSCGEVTIRYKGIICDKCGVEVTRAIVRRERMGHIALASPVSHIWFLRGVPSKIGILLNMSVADLEKVIYFAGYIVTKIDEHARMSAIDTLEREFKTKSKEVTGSELEQLKETKDRLREDLRGLSKYQILSEIEYHRISRKFGEMFEASIGAEALRAVFAQMSLSEVLAELELEAPNQSVLHRQKTIRRIQVIKGMLSAGIKPEYMFLTVIPIIPPDLRPMVQLDGGRYATSD